MGDHADRAAVLRRPRSAGSPATRARSGSAAASFARSPRTTRSTTLSPRRLARAGAPTTPRRQAGPFGRYWLSTTAATKSPTDSLDHERPVLPDQIPQRRVDFQQPLSFGPVGGEAVLAAEPVVIDPGHVRRLRSRTSTRHRPIRAATAAPNRRAADRG